LRPRPDSDGKYGRLEALNLETKKVLWTNRQRAPLSSGVLATAGGVVFAGALDRVFAAYDDADGKELWRVRLNDVPNSAPISYSINGRQYVAVVVGNGGAQAATFPVLVPEIRNPPDRGAAIWVFELPDRLAATAR
jgi:glucose dehydrogenase